MKINSNFNFYNSNTIESGEDTLLSFKSGVDGEFLQDSLGVAITADTDEHLRIKTTCNLPQNPSIIYPILDGKIANLRGVFRQGFGLGGPSGFLNEEAVKEQGLIESYGVIAIKTDKGWLCLFARDNRDYILKFDVRYDLRDDVFRLSAGFKVEGTTASPSLTDIEVIYREKLSEVLEFASDRIKEDYNPPACDTPAYLWCSWYYYYNNFDFKQLKEFLEGAKSIKPRIEVEYILIDAGYFVSAGDWLSESHLWEGGLKKAFLLIEEYGYKPGIWIAPFMVGNRSEIFKAHPDWMIRYNSGEYIKPWQMYNEPKVWGYQDEEYYVMDTSNKGAMEYLLGVFRTLKSWGAKLFKTDFMLWGIQDSDKVQRSQAGKTSVQYYRDFMQEIRACIGESYWLGCIAPMLPSLGFVNAMRIAGDVGAMWGDDGFGPTNMIGQILGENYVNGKYWQNDPDALILRDYHVFLKENETIALALLQALSGGVVYTSETLHKLPSERLDLFRFLKPDDKVRKANLPFIDSNEKLIVVHHDLGGKHIILLFNQTKEEVAALYQLKDIITSGKAYLFKWNSGESCSELQSTIACKVPPHSAALYFANEHEKITEEPENIWKF